MAKGKRIVLKRNRIDAVTLITNGNYILNCSGADIIYDGWYPATSSTAVPTGVHSWNHVVRLISDGVSKWHIW